MTNSMADMSSLEKLFAKKPTPIDFAQQPSALAAEKSRPDLDVTKSVFYSATRRPTLPEFLHTNYLQLPQFKFVWEKAGWRGHLEEPRVNEIYGAWSSSNKKQEQLHETSRRKENRQGTEADSEEAKSFCAGRNEEERRFTVRENPAVASPGEKSVEEKLQGETRQLSKPRVRKVVKGGSIVTITGRRRTRDSSLGQGESAVQQKGGLCEEPNVHRLETATSVSISDQVNAAVPEMGAELSQKGQKDFTGAEGKTLQSEDVLMKTKPEEVQASSSELNSLVTDPGELSSQIMEVNSESKDPGLKHDQSTPGTQNSHRHDKCIISEASDVLQTPSQTKGALDEVEIENASENLNRDELMNGNDEGILAQTNDKSTSADLGNPLDTNSQCMSGGKFSKKTFGFKTMLDAKGTLRELGTVDDVMASSNSTGNKLTLKESSDISTEQAVSKPGEQCSRSDGSNSEVESVEELVMADYDSDDCLDIESPKSEDKQNESEEETSEEEEHSEAQESSTQRGMASRTRSASKKRQDARKKRTEANKKKHIFKRHAGQKVRAYLWYTGVSNGPRNQSPKQHMMSNSRSLYSRERDAQNKQRISHSHNAHKDRWGRHERYDSKDSKTHSLKDWSPNAQKHHAKNFRSGHTQESFPGKQSREERRAAVAVGRMGISNDGVAVGDAGDLGMPSSLLSCVGSCAVDITIAASEKEPVGKKICRGPGNKKKKRRDNNQPKERRQPPPVRLETKPPICVFYKQGVCRKRDDCPFRHEGPTVERQPVRKKCKFYATYSCERDECPFLHSSFPCHFFHTMSYCRHGDSCKFSHDPLTSETRRLLEEVCVPPQCTTALSSRDKTTVISLASQDLHCDDNRAPTAENIREATSWAVTPEGRDHLAESRAHTAEPRAHSAEPRGHHRAEYSPSDVFMSGYNLRATSTRKRRTSEGQSPSDTEKRKHDDSRKKSAVESNEAPPPVFLPGMYKDTSQ